jgi:hypothetical protein
VVIRSLLCLAFAVVLLSRSLAAEGTLKVNFKLEGPAPKPKVVAGVGGVAFCGPLGLTDESLVVGKTGGVQNVVMWMHTTSTSKAPDNPAALKPLAKEAKVDNKDCRYQPRVVLVHTSQQLVIGNPDPIGHNSKGDLFANPSFNELIPSGGSAKIKLFTKSESRPMPLACSIHPWMSGWVLIKDHPYFGVSDANGDLKIEYIPEGTYTFVVWHERTGFVQKAKQQGKDVEWKKGQLSVKIAGETNLGEVVVPIK